MKKISYAFALFFLSSLSSSIIRGMEQNSTGKQGQSLFQDLITNVEATAEITKKKIDTSKLIVTFNTIYNTKYQSQLANINSELEGLEYEEKTNQLNLHWQSKQNEARKLLLNKHGSNETNLFIFEHG